MICIHIILVYDITLIENGTTIWRKTFKTCCRYLTHIQNSVFEGDLSESQIMSLKIDLKKIVRKDLDSVILFSVNNPKWIEKEFIGKIDEKTSSFF